jgi:hypothetical protein
MVFEDSSFGQEMGFLAWRAASGDMRQQGSATCFFAERCAVKDPIDYLSIKLLGIEASASGHFAIVAVVVIAFALIATRTRR